MAVIFGTQGRDTLPGTDRDDFIQGWAEDGDPATDLGDVLRGFGGNDELFGGGGTDELSGGDGSDTLDGGDAGDMLSGGADDDALFGRQGRDALQGEGGSDALSGGDASDGLFGGNGDDRLFGGDAGDRLLGERGDDRLDGGAGSDRFVFAGLYRRDTILDFKDDVDTIELDGASLGVTSKADALSLATVVNGNTVFNFGGGDVLVVNNIADPQLLRDDIVIV